MTAKKASLIRADRMRGALSNSEKRKEAKGKKETLPVKWTLDNLWEAYKEANPKDEKHGGRSREIWLFNKRLKNIFGNKTVDDLTTHDIDKFRNQLLKKGLKPATVRLPMELMRRLFNFGEKQGYCVVPRTLQFNFPKVDNEKTEYLTDDELLRYEQALEEYTSTKNSDEKQFFVAYAHLVMHTGFRRTAAILALRKLCNYIRYPSIRQRKRRFSHAGSGKPTIERETGERS